MVSMKKIRSSCRESNSDHPIVQLVASHYTEGSILALYLLLILHFFPGFRDSILLPLAYKFKVIPLC